MNAVAEIFRTLGQLTPKKASFTEEDIPSLHGKVFVVTGANGGMGKEVVRILYERHARVYMTARSQEKAQRARTDIIATVPFSEGELITVLLDLGDLNTVRSAANEITQREKEIQVLFNNAGIGIATAEAQTTEQGFDRWLGVNNVAPHLFTKLLAPALREAAKVEKPGAVRVVWVSSISGVLPDVPSGGVPLHHIAGNRDDVELEKYQKKYGIETRYGISRAGNILQAAQFARFFDRDGVTSIAMHPGVIETESFTPIAEKNTLAWIFKILFMQPAIYGARTQVFAGLSPEITMGSYLGKWVVPCGRLVEVRKDLQLAMKTSEEGDQGQAQAFWEWNEKQIQDF